MKEGVKKCQPSGQYGKDNNKNLHFYCEFCDKEMGYDEDRVCTMNHTNWIEEFEDLMFNLPVNDYRVSHEDLITKEKRLTVRGEVIKQFIQKAVDTSREEGRREVVKELQEKVNKYDGPSGLAHEFYLEECINSLQEDSNNNK